MTLTFYDVIEANPAFNSPLRNNSMDLVEPITRKAVESILQDAAKLGQPLMVFETYRSRERQAALYKAGATQLPIVGVHHYGLAVDLVKDVDGEPSWKGAFDFLGMLAIKYKLLWGGTWRNFPDLSHVQRVAVKDQPALFAGTFYPSADYSPYRDYK